jgi:hypothetical protein
VTRGRARAGLVGAAAAVCLAAPLAAQISIRVVDSSGRPAPAVRVDVFGRGEIISVASTSAEGVAELSAERWTEARRLSLSHLTYRTLIVQVEDIPGDGVIVIEPQAMPIDPLTVEIGQLCPIVDEPAARQLWSQVAALYATDTGSRAVFARLSLSRSSVPSDRLHRTDDVEVVEGVTTGGWGAPPDGDLLRATLEERIDRAGYAWPPFTIDGGTIRATGWTYPPLDVRAAYHFASRTFGALHDFAVMSESDERTTLVFCGNGRANGADIYGTIALAPRRAFLDAEWRFETDDPDEGAGGSVTFASVNENGSLPHLVSSRGLFYRHSGVEPPYPNLPRTYVREVTANVRWYVFPGGAGQPCVGSVAFWDDSLPAPDPDGARLAACVAEHWPR